MDDERRASVVLMLLGALSAAGFLVLVFAIRACVELPQQEQRIERHPRGFIDKADRD